MNEKIKDLLTPTMTIEVQYRDSDGQPGGYVCYARVLGHLVWSDAHQSKFDAEAQAAERLYYFCMFKLHKDNTFTQK